MSQQLTWGIIGAGNIAKAFATGVNGSKTGKLLAIASRSQEKADKFGDEFKIPRRYASYEALLADKDVQAVYVATPHPMHAEWAIRAAEAKKHLLVEKPIGLNHAEAMAIVEAAIANDVFLMEAYMYRCHPQVARVVELIKSKAIGDVKVLHATFSFHWPKPFNPDSRLTSNALGGGGILDVGGYPISMARLIAGAATGKDFAEPTEIKGLGHLESTGIDGYASAILKFPGDIIAQCATGVQLAQENVVRIFGTDGSIFIPVPWVPARDGGSAKIFVRRSGQDRDEEIEFETNEGIYSLEADTVAANLSRRQAIPPAMSWEDTLGNMKTLDAWRQQIGLIYDSEKFENLKPVNRRPVKRESKGKMKYGRIEGVEKPISRLVMGVDNVTFPPHLAVMFDDFFERGGNAFDSAYIYGGGKCEQALGAWVKARGLRDEVVLLGKGAHTPDCNPTAITHQLLETLRRLQTDALDIYMMHRDNPEIPVGEFIDVLNEHVNAGRIRVFGGSNWSIARIEEANAYAKKNGKRGFGAVSNNFSLARMVEPVWAGCIAASDPASRAWFTKTQMPLMPWSSQARGFFTERAHQDRALNDEEMNRCWYSEDNWQRRQRVIELAKRRNVEPIAIALAYVLNQPFPTFPLIGPRQLSETRTSMAAMDVELSSQDLKWLNLEE